jgi:hypothetical protein
MSCLNQVSVLYKQYGTGQTLRHYYYKLLSSGALRLTQKENSGDNAYKFVSRILVDARENGLLPWEAIIDTGRRKFTYHSYSSLESYVRVESRSGFSLDPWRGQKRRLEVWVEKDAMAEITNSAVAALRIPVYIAKGYGSATVKNDAKERYGDGTGWTMLYCGDFDPSGMDIERELQEKLALYGSRPEVVRVTLTQEETLTLPPYAALDLKNGDSRNAAFKRKYGEGQKRFELDVLSSAEIRERLLRAVSTYLDPDAFQAAERLERIIREEASKRLKQAMSDFGQVILSRGAPGCPLPLDEQLRYLQEKTV